MKTPYFLAIFGVLINSPMVMAAQGPDAGRPNEHSCPITLTVMQDPVVACDGHSYERASIERWFAQGNKSPVTGAQIPQTLIPNHSLKAMINDWKPGRTNKPSILVDRPAAEIVERVKAEFAKNKALLCPGQSAKGRHVVAFLGNTGAGKSTLYPTEMKNRQFIFEQHGNSR